MTVVMIGDRRRYTARIALAKGHEIAAEHFKGIGSLRMTTVARLQNRRSTRNKFRPSANSSQSCLFRHNCSRRGV
jgi:hypothetical protein